MNKAEKNHTIINNEGMIYLVQPAELVNTPRYKIGCSKESTPERIIKGYRKGTRFICFSLCSEPHKKENILKSKFNEKYKLIAGNEFYEINSSEAHLISYFIECFHEIIKHEQKINNVENTKENELDLIYDENIKMESIIENKLFNISVKRVAGDEYEERTSTLRMNLLYNKYYNDIRDLLVKCEDWKGHLSVYTNTTDDKKLLNVLNKFVNIWCYIYNEQVEWVSIISIDNRIYQTCTDKCNICNKYHQINTVKVCYDPRGDINYHGGYEDCKCQNKIILNNPGKYCERYQFLTKKYILDKDSDIYD